MIRKATVLPVVLVLMVLLSGWAIARTGPDKDQAPPDRSSAESGLAFVQANKRYTIRWQPGDNEVYNVVEVRGAWARARRERGSAAQEGSGPVEVWLNLNQAITITEQR